MTELVIKFDDDSLLPSLKKVLKAIPGIHVFSKREKKDPTCMTKKEFFDKIDESKKEYEEGKFIHFDKAEDMDRWLKSL